VESYQKELAIIRTILKKNPKGMTVTDISREMDINRNSVAKYLDILLISGHTEMITFGPAKVFFPSRRIPLSAMLNFTLDYIILLDRDLKVIQMNNNLLKIMSLKQKDIVSRSIEEFSSSIFQIPELIKNAQKALNGKESIIERKFLIEEKEKYFGIKHIPTTFDDGEPGVTIIIEDITERKENENKMKQAVKEWNVTFNSVSDMISILDKDFNIIRANKSFAKLFNCKPENCVGKKCYDLLHGTKKTHSPCPYEQVQSKKEPVTVEFFEPKIGKKLEITTFPIFNDDGEIFGSVHIMKDITIHTE
jgi:PAS domain S-box-containing protein